MLNNLVCNPLALLNSLGSRTEGHEVALDNVLGILRVKPEREGSRQMVGGDEVVPGSHDAVTIIHANSLSE